MFLEFRVILCFWRLDKYLLVEVGLRGARVEFRSLVVIVIEFGFFLFVIRV